MAKRRATSELNHDNWDIEEESEEPGSFKPLSQSELKDRVIKKAKRTLGNTEKGISGSSPFAAFSGFSTSKTSSNPFSFLKKDNVNSPFSAVPMKEEKNGSSTVEERKTEEVKNDGSTKKITDSKTSNKQKPTRSIEYYRQLQSLNESVMKWMQFHLSKNSCCDFTPVFNDYKKHLDTLNVTYPIKVKENAPEEKIDIKNADSTDNDSKSSDVNYDVKIGSNIKNDDETDYGANFKSSTTNTSTFSFGIKKTPTATSSSTSSPNISLKEEAAVEKKSFQFSFGLKTTPFKNSEGSDINKPFTFASAAVDKSASEITEEPEYIPPKNDFVAVKEEDAFYSKRCKLFIKKDDGYVERGVGILYLKPLDGKTQLLIRADTNLGNILLNIILNESLPMSRTGKNNVLLICIPNPPLDINKTDPKEATPILIRVKTSEDADELLQTLNKYKS